MRRYWPVGLGLLAFACDAMAAGAGDGVELSLPWMVRMLLALLIGLVAEYARGVKAELRASQAKVDALGTRLGGVETEMARLGSTHPTRTELTAEIHEIHQQLARIGRRGDMG